MSYVFEPTEPLGRQCRSLLHERLDLAIAAVYTAAESGDEVDVSTAVHDARKRCKEVRALARIFRSAVPQKRFGRFDRQVDRAADQLATLRDAHALLATFDRLRALGGDDAEHDFDSVRAGLAAAVIRASGTSKRVGGPLDRACELLESADGSVDRLTEPLTDGDVDDAAVLASGLGRSYATARKRRRRLDRDVTEERLHQWRTAVKRLWYHVRLVERAAPSALAPQVDRLHDLGEALGDDHDLAVLIERIEADPEAHGGASSSATVIAAARAQQAELRSRAMRLGSSVLVERPEAFIARVDGYWKLAREAGPEIPTGGLLSLIDEQASDEDQAFDGRADAAVERERKFLVDRASNVPESGAGEVELRQGYLAIDGRASVRIRDDGRGSYSMTVKAGGGAVRTEIEWPLTEGQFAAAWPHTEGRRIHKTRSTVPIGERIAEVDVFHGALDGLVIAEVEFDDDETLHEFEAPAWFGREVTDDPAYTNASLSVADPAGETDSGEPWRPPSGPRHEVGG